MCLPALVLSAGGASAQVGPWTAHTSFRDARSVAPSATHVWVGTTGGLFSLDRETSEIQTYTVVDGLHTVAATNIVYDERRDVLWIGYADGVLDRLNPANGVIRSFRDIERATQYSSRRINRLKMNGDTLYVATDFGIVVFDAERAEVRDSYTRLGAFNPAIAVHDVDFGLLDDGSPGIWVATAEGVAYADRTFINLQDPSVWTAEPVVSEDGIRAIAVFDSVYVGSANGLFVRDSVATYTARGTFGQGVYRLYARPDRLVGVADFQIIRVTQSGSLDVLVIELSLPSAVAFDDDGTAWVATRSGGLVHVGGGPPEATFLEVIDTYVPDGPREGQFSAASVGPGGSLLLGGVDGTNTGFYHLKPDGSWGNYNPFDTPEIGLRTGYRQVNIDDANTLWAGSFGGGLVRVDESGSIERYDHTNSTLQPAGSSSDFVVIAGVDNDSGNNTWVTTLGAPLPLHRRSPDGSWTGLPPFIGQGLIATSTAYGAVFVDSFDQKWIIVRNETSFNDTRGLLVADTGSDPTDPDDDAFRFFGSAGANGQGLPSIVVRDVVEDRAGVIWIGTELGLAYMINNGIVARDANATPIWPQRADRTEGPFLFLGLEVTALAVDPANRLWVGTPAGIRIVESVEGGFREIEPPLTTLNAPLPSNVILDIAVEPQSGIIYVVTDAGMVSTQGEATEPVARIAELFVYPNPADYTSGNPQIFIEGLAETSTVTIVSPDGGLVRRIDARGGRISWDGLDTAGSPVPSGVYIVVGVGANGEGTGYGKVAVIR